MTNMTNVEKPDLNLTPQPDEYVEFADTDVVHTQTVQLEDTPLGGTIVWRHAATSLSPTRIINRQVQADFLSGGITSGCLAGAAYSFPTLSTGRPVVFANSTGYKCSTNPHVPACQAHTDVCPVPIGTELCASLAFCPTGAFVCL